MNTNPPISSDEALDRLCETYVNRLPDNNQMSKRFVGGFIKGIFADIKHNHLQALSRPAAPLPEVGALDRAFELLDRIDIQCKHVGHPVGGIYELKAIYRAALNPQPAQDARKDFIKAYEAGELKVRNDLTGEWDTVPQTALKQEVEGLDEAIEKDLPFDTDFYATHGKHRCGVWLEAARLYAAQPKKAHEPCQYCHDTGGVFDHADDCNDDLCALNGDIHSCNGKVVPCNCAAQHDTAEGE